MDIKNDLQAVLSTQADRIIEDLLAVHADKLRILCLIEVRLRIFASLPGQDQLGRDRDTQYIEAVIRDRTDRCFHIAAPASVKDVCAGVITEPVYTGQPDLFSVFIDDPVPDSSQPVIAIHRIKRSYHGFRSF